MSFRLVPKSVTLNDLERRNSRNLCVISPNLVAFWTDYVKAKVSVYVQPLLRNPSTASLYRCDGFLLLPV